MSNEELEKKLNEMTKKILDINTFTEEKKSATEKEINTTISDIKGKVNEEYNLLESKVVVGKNKLFSNILKAKMNAEAKKDEIEKEVSKKKFENEKSRDEYKSLCLDNYALYAMDFAIWAAEEAQIASLQAISFKKEMVKKYKNTKK